MSIIVIEAGIGAGKSTLLKKLSNFVHTLPEPLETWQDFYGTNYLHLCYENPQQNFYQFQNLVQLTLLQRNMKLISGEINVLERSLDSIEKVFLPLASHLGYLNPAEHKLLET